MDNKMEMRAVLCGVLDEYMEKDESICLLDADLAMANGTHKLRFKYPERALDVGIAEQNMAGVAAGLTSFGFKPFITTFTPFATRRIADQIAISISYAKRNVKIVGTDPGVMAEMNGGTHMCMSDIGITRAIPGIVVYEPVDAVQFAQALPQIIDYEGPLYIRMARKTVPPVFGDGYKFDLFKADVLTEGKDVTIIASGMMVSESIEAQKELAAAGIDAEVINLHTIKPVDEETLLASVKKTGAVVTADNGNIIGGVFSAVSELLAEKYPLPVVPVGVMDRFGEVGALSYLKDAMHLNVSDIVAAAKKAVAEK